jgi:hypothetical protein
VKLADVMDELAAELDTITGLQVIAYPAKSVVVPAAVIDFPETYSYDATFGRGTDTLTIPIHVAVGDVWDKNTRDTLSQFVDGSGVASVKAVLEAGTYTACDTVSVTEVEFAPIQIAGVVYFGAVFTVEIAGPGVSS